jgi:hypothetical protein
MPSDETPWQAKATARHWTVIFIFVLIPTLYLWPSKSGIARVSQITERNGLDVFSDQSIVPDNATLERRQTYQCGPGNPCSNGACCGSAGFCGYGPTYCGTGRRLLSNGYVDTHPPQVVSPTATPMQSVGSMQPLLIQPVLWMFAVLSLAFVEQHQTSAPVSWKTP